MDRLKAKTLKPRKNCAEFFIMVIELFFPLDNASANPPEPMLIQANHCPYPCEAEQSRWFPSDLVLRLRYSVPVCYWRGA